MSRLAAICPSATFAHSVTDAEFWVLPVLALSGLLSLLAACPPV